MVSASLTTSADAEISFTETTQEAGLTYTGPTWGTQWTDYNGDGWPDIFVTNHEAKVPNLYQNMQDGTFEQLPDTIWDQMPFPLDTHGAGWADFDNDGDQDVYISAGTYTQYNHFYVNDNGALSERSDEYGISYIENRGRMPLWLDFDNDGLLDIYVNGFSMGGVGYSGLFQQNGAIFENVTSLVGMEPHNTAYSMMSDLTGDGILDLIHYDDDTSLPGFPNHLWSMATIPFTDHRDEIFPLDIGFGTDAAFSDFNNDLLPDLYLARPGGGNQVAQVTSTKLAASFITDECGCERGVTFKTNGILTLLFSLRQKYLDHPIFIGSSGYPAEEFEGYIAPDDPRIWGYWPRVPVYLELDPDNPKASGMFPYEPGVDYGVFIGFDEVLNEWKIVSSVPFDEDFECRFIAETDGSPISDLTLLNINMFQPAVDSLYIHNGVQLEKRTSQSGIVKNLPGRSVVTGDFDNDMDVDIYVVNSMFVQNTPNSLYENTGAGDFIEVPDAGGAAGTTLGLGDHVVTADYNRDGFLDLFVTNGRYPPPFDHLGPIQLFKNNGNNNHWIEIDLVGTTSNRDGIGARVLVTAGGKTQLREQGGGMHRDSQNHTRIHFGLGQNSTIQSLEVQWPSGIVQVLENLAADKIIQVVESSGGPQPPVAVGDSATTDTDTATTVSVLSNDYDPNGDTLTIIAVQSLTDQSGIATINDNASPSDPNDDFIDYTPPGGFSGTDTFTYTIDDGNGFTDSATVTVTVGTSTTCNPYGIPNYDPATEDGIFLWQEGNVWHLRAIAGLSGWQRYTGSIVSDMPFNTVTPVSFEANDILDTSNSQLITFDMNMSRPYFDGLDFEFPAGATVSFDVQANYGNAADLVFIGGDQCPVAQLPYQLSLGSNTAPVAAFTADPTSGEVPLYVTFDASMSYDPDADGSIVSYEWDYDDGTGSGVTTSHTYNATGIYTVSLAVTDDYGVIDTISQTITVEDRQNTAPVAIFTADPTIGNAPLEVTFNASMSYDPDADGSIVSYEWDYDDGTGSGVTTSHTYNEPGTYTVSLTVTDDYGVTDTTSQIITVEDPQNTAPVAIFTADPTSGEVSLYVTFDASTSYDPDADGSIVSYEWDFDDGTGSGVTTSHTYNEPGTYTVSLTVTDDYGVTNTTSQIITVEDPQNTAPVAAFTADPTSGEVSLYVTFDASTSYDPDGGSIVSYEWDYDDGTGSGVTTSHTYNEPGIYDVSLTVTDDDGFSDTTSQIITVGTSSTCNPYGEPNYDPATEDGIFLWQEGNVWHLRAVAGLSGWQRFTGNIVSNMEFSRVTPVNLEASDILDTSNSQVITFDMTMSRPYFDGIDFEFPVGATVSFDFQASSGVAADLVFIGENQCPVDQLPYQLSLDSNTAPVAIFTADPTLGNAPLEVTFNASMSYDPDGDGSIVSYEWDYDDGTGSGAATSHTYNAPGIYNVSLTVTDDDGFSDTTSQIITVGTSSTCNPYGEPNYDPATEDGIFLWQEGNVWHLRAVAGLSGWQRFTGNIVSNMEFSRVTPVNLEASDILDTSNSQVITFDMTMSRPYFDGIDFEFPAGATVYFDVQTNSGVAADLVFIGGNRCPVAQLPYQLSIDSNTAPTASFTADPIAGEASLTVSFDASGSTDEDGSIVSYVWDYGDDEDGSIVSYTWDYGDGTSGIETTHTYTEDGSYTVILTVTDEDGASSTATQTITVVEPENIAPIAIFTADPVSGVYPLEVNFDASGSTDEDGLIVLYTWDYGDGTSGIETNHTYTEDGSYTVILTVTDEDGASRMATQTITVTEPENIAPVAIFTADPVSGVYPLEVNFDASGSTDEDGSIVSYAWDYGDGTSGSETNHTYTEDGTYTVILTVTDEDGVSSMATQTVTVAEPENIAPVAIFTADPVSGVYPLEVNFDASGSTDEDGSIVSYAWDYGDGTSGSETNHTYTEDGTYTVILTVTDEDGASSMATQTVTVAEPENIAPVAIFTADPVSGVYPLEVNFDASGSTDEDGSIVSYAWDYGDGTSGSETNHTYTEDGTYTVILTVTDEDGASSMATQTVTVAEPENIAPVAIFTADPVSGVYPLEVNFDASGSTDEDGSIVSYAWDYGDGTSGSETNHTYTEDGTYTVILTVTDEDGASSMATQTVTVAEPENIAPVAIFTADPVSGVYPLEVNFDASGSTDEDGSIVSYAWDYGDGTSGSETNHTYTEDGSYTVILTVTDEDGASSMATQTVTVAEPENIAPVAIFTADPVSGVYPLEVNFDASGSTDEDGLIVSYAWDYGDGTSGSETNHTYTEDGTYTVILTVTDNDDDTNTANQTITVE
ncbi:PKD domain-containing protein [Desulfosediminicola flagellatus]|uniref:PKD domain-containing protein n=1 Tax=Desulfosediminicola flagellatus TaxID=2569541 RepID=UPI001592E29A|nr:PKD domain-containing protein [Desulfosediminicola flagellatus]